MEQFDYIFTGGGCAALSTVYHMQKYGLQHQRILIIDRDDKVSNDRTWCYWTRDAHPFPQLVHQTWSNIAFADHAGKLRGEMAGFEYAMVRSADFYDFIKKSLATNPNIHFLKADIQSVEDISTDLIVHTDIGAFRTQQVLNSILDWKALQAQTGQYLLTQHFMGWWIESEQADFTPEEAVLMDFRTPQEDATRFFYVLPLTKKKALVEFTLFSKETLEDIEYRSAIHQYIRSVLQLEEYKIVEEEFGVIPMTNVPLPKALSDQMIHIGTAAGAVKPTTGYAFLNIIEQSKVIAKRLLGLKEEDFPKTRKRFAFYDRLLLHILSHAPSNANQIFSRLFRRNPMHRILNFLGERTHLAQEGAIFLRLPFRPFLNALFFAWRRKVEKQSKPYKPIGLRMADEKAETLVNQI